MLTEFTSKVAVIEAQWDTMHRLVGQVQEHAQRIAAIEARCESNTEWSQRTEVPIDSDGVVAEPVGVGCPVKGRRDR
jgi:hypothetical protein